MSEQIPLTESRLQAKFWSHCWQNYPQARHCIWAVPNDAIGQHTGLKDVLRSNELKATGLLNGVWDLHCFWHGKLHIIETKLPGASLTVDRIITSKSGQPNKVFGQKEWGELMASHGAIRHIYHSLPEGIAIFESILNGTATDCFGGSTRP